MQSVASGTRLPGFRLFINWHCNFGQCLNYSLPQFSYPESGDSTGHKTVGRIEWIICGEHWEHNVYGNFDMPSLGRKFLVTSLAFWQPVPGCLSTCSAHRNSVDIRKLEEQEKKIKLQGILQDFFFFFLALCRTIFLQVSIVIIWHFTKKMFFMCVN